MHPRGTQFENTTGLCRFIRVWAGESLAARIAPEWNILLENPRFSSVRHKAFARAFLRAPRISRRQAGERW
jgi:hypothetical protein